MGRPQFLSEKAWFKVAIAVPNSRPAVKQASLVLEAVNDKTGQVEKRCTSTAVDLSDGRATLATDVDWENPRLWWPAEPNCYRLRSTVQVDGQPVDVQETLFGFRRWTRDGIHLRPNGVQIIGCDNGAFVAKRPADFRDRVRPLLNSGGRRGIGSWRDPGSATAGRSAA